MNNDICKQVTLMLSNYIENKLTQNERLFVEDHFVVCSDCRKKFYEMNNIMNSLHFEYEKMLNEFQKIEENKISNINEYETFYNNISPYIDDELCYEDSLKFRKYLLKSKPARDELSDVYRLRNTIKESTINFMDKSNVNFSKKVIKRLKEENKYLFPNIYKRAAIAIGFMISILTALLIFIGLNYFNSSYADISNKSSAQNIIFHNDEDWVEFFFDEEGNALLANK